MIDRVSFSLGLATRDVSSDACIAWQAAQAAQAARARREQERKVRFDNR
jgi:hypothetical protein